MIIISLRGNAGSGKSTISQMLIEALQEENDVLYLEMDNFRRNIINTKLDEAFKVRRNAMSQSSMISMIDWAFENKIGFVILDGKFNTKYFSNLYEHIISRNIKLLPYWFDLSFEETAKRHATREKSKAFSADEMKDWFSPNDLLTMTKEKLIPQEMTKEQIFAMIMNDIKSC